MRFTKPLIHGTLIHRYKRFLADVKLDDGTVVIAHCTNTGSMKSCLETGAEVYLSPMNNPNRKTKFTWEMIKINGDWVGINTTNSNKLAFKTVSGSIIDGLNGYNEVKKEVKWNDSRFDLMVKNDREICFIEVKNVSLKAGEWALFPDAVTTRGKKHLETLIRVKEAGMRAVMLYVVQRSDVSKFGPADEIDPEYGMTLRKAVKKGVEVFVVQTKVTPEEITIIKSLPMVL